LGADLVAGVELTGRVPFPQPGPGEEASEKSHLNLLKVLAHLSTHLERKLAGRL
jgi:hypothetical protein